jgi:hypothetical protein
VVLRVDVCADGGEVEHEGDPGLWCDEWGVDALQQRRPVLVVPALQVAPLLNQAAHGGKVAAGARVAQEVHGVGATHDDREREREREREKEKKKGRERKRKKGEGKRLMSMMTAVMMVA